MTGADQEFTFTGYGFGTDPAAVTVAFDQQPLLVNSVSDTEINATLLWGLPYGPVKNIEATVEPKGKVDVSPLPENAVKGDLVGSATDPTDPQSSLAGGNYYMYIDHLNTLTISFFEPTCAYAFFQWTFIGKHPNRQNSQACLVFLGLRLTIFGNGFLPNMTVAFTKDGYSKECYVEEVHFTNCTCVTPELEEGQYVIELTVEKEDGSSVVAGEHHLHKRVDLDLRNHLINKCTCCKVRNLDQGKSKKCSWILINIHDIWWKVVKIWWIFHENS